MPARALVAVAAVLALLAPGAAEPPSPATLALPARSASGVAAAEALLPWTAGSGALALGAAATRAQLGLLGLAGEPVPPPAGLGPGEALLALAAARGHEGPEAARAAAQLDALPPPLAGALARLLEAFLAADGAARAAFAGADARALDPAAPASPPGLLGPVLAARLGLLEAAGALEQALRATPRAALPAGPIVVAGLLHVDLGHAPGVHDAPVALLVDGGGDDVYRNNAGGSGGVVLPGCARWPGQNLVPGAAALLDLGGDDRYEPAVRCAANGGAGVGSGFLYDASGDDQYLAEGGSAVNGGAGLGAGFLLDGAGHDVYLGGSYANGGAGQGTGALVDLAGDDAYEALGHAANGGGYLQGHGMLVDAAGSDRYLAGCCGANGGGWFAGGRGFLLDAAGHDAYLGAHAGVNGGGASFGAGLLWDEAGDDTYTAGRVGVNGGAAWELGCLFLCVVSFSEGLLVDRQGLDQYRDQTGGTGTDRTVLLKGAVGHQLDLACQPGNPPPGPPAKRCS